MSPNGEVVNGELVRGESTGFVRTEDGDGSQFLDGSDMGDAGPVFGKLLGTDCKGDGQDSEHDNGNTANQEDEDAIETTTVTVVVGGVENKDPKKDEGVDGDETE